MICPKCNCDLDTWEEFQRETELARRLVKIEKDRLKAIEKRSKYGREKENYEESTKRNNK